MAEREQEHQEQEHDAGAAPPALSSGEHADVAGRKAGSAKVVHEVVRQQGDEELERPALSLLVSGFAAGVAISASLLAQAFLKVRLGEAGWTELVVRLGYTIGFIVVILGRLQLFTESTVTAVLPVAAGPSLSNAGRLLRLWTLVLLANLAGTLLVALLVARGVIVSPAQREAAVALSRVLLTHDWPTAFCLAMPAGFLIAAIAWILPNARGSEIWVVFMVTYVIAVGGFTHVVVGSVEAWLLWVTGEATLARTAFELILPALLGNVVGGTGLFALLAHGQVRHEL